MCNPEIRSEEAETDIPVISTRQMIEVDRIMAKDLGIGLVQMMENAGANLAALARSRFLSGDALNKKVTILAGSGANGGGVLAAARHLHNWGADVRVCTTRVDSAIHGATSDQLKTLRMLGIDIFEGFPPPHDQVTDLILDGIIGYNLKGAPLGMAAEFIRWANAAVAPVLSMDVPSGIDASTGKVHEPAIKAAATMTLALPKKGLMAGEAKERAGEIYLADIGVPPSLYRRGGIGIETGHIFSKGSVIRLCREEFGFRAQEVYKGTYR